MLTILLLGPGSVQTFRSDLFFRLFVSLFCFVLFFHTMSVAWGTNLIVLNVWGCGWVPGMAPPTRRWT